jgi:exo-beta-1,3-glucanase (GH17 family)
LKVILGVWITRNHRKNAALIDNGLSLAKNYTGVVTAIIIGSEVLLRGDMSASDLRQTIRSAKPRIDVPVSYADTWDFWLRYRDIGNDLDFVTVSCAALLGRRSGPRGRRGGACG